VMDSELVWFVFFCFYLVPSPLVRVLLDFLIFLGFMLALLFNSSSSSSSFLFKMRAHVWVSYLLFPLVIRAAFRIGVFLIELASRISLLRMVRMLSFMPLCDRCMTYEYMLSCPLFSVMMDPSDVGASPPQVSPGKLAFFFAQLKSLSMNFNKYMDGP